MKDEFGLDIPKKKDGLSWAFYQFSRTLLNVMEKAKQAEEMEERNLEIQRTIWFLQNGFRKNPFYNPSGTESEWIRG